MLNQRINVTGLTDRQSCYVLAYEFFRTAHIDNVEIDLRPGSVSSVVVTSMGPVNRSSIAAAISRAECRVVSDSPSPYGTGPYTYFTVEPTPVAKYRGNLPDSVG